MLRLKKLQILGFKSFCDKTDIQFPGSGVVGIVGPNGCGKSNIADAISWVLGEQSAKSLRGGRMEDVIFAGTRDRPATGMAEVSLTLIDPEEFDLAATTEPEPPDAESEATAGWSDEDANSADEMEEAAAPAAAAGGAVVLTIRKRRKFHAHNRRGEVVVTRRLYRDGESEYLMNGRPCRLRDIQDLFMGTGLGPESYAIIEQGRIGQILSSKPYDRRAIIEEAAGVSKYKAKRRLAEARLEASRLNLSRINDIFEEVTKQVGSLKRQAAKAQRYQVLKAEFDQQQRALIGGRARAFGASQTQLITEQAAAQAAVQGAQQTIAGMERARAEGQQACSQLERELRQMTEECARLVLERDHATQQIEFNHQQRQDLARRAEASAVECARLEQQIATMGQELEQAASDQDAAGGLAETARAAYAERRTEHQARQAAVEELDREIETIRRQTLALMARSAQLGNQITHGETLLTELGKQLERLAREEAGARAELEAGGRKRGQLALEFQDQESENLGLAERHAELEQRMAQLRADDGRERADEQRLRNELAEVAARRRSLEEIVAHHGYSSEAVKHLFAGRAAQGEAQTEFQPMGVLGEFVEVDAPYDQVVEQFLHDELNYIVVKSWDQAGAGVGLLRTQEQGRATFLIHGDEGHGEGSGEPGGRPQVPAETSLVPLLGEVKALNGFRKGLGEILPKLRDAFLAGDTAQAQRLAASHPRAYFLTPNGECFHNFTVSGGTGTSSGPLSLKRELRELARREAGQQTEIEQRGLRLELLARQLAETGAEMESVRSRRHELDKRLVASSQSVRQLDHELERAESLRRQVTLETERAMADQRQATEKVADARGELDRIVEETRAMQERETALNQTVESGRGAREAAAIAMSEAQAESARVEERARAAVAACHRLRQSLADLNRRLQQGRAEEQTLAARQAELLAASSVLEQSVAGLAQALATAQERQTAQETALASARAEAAAAERELSAERDALDAKRQALNELEITLARLEADLEHLRETCRNDLGCELDALLAEPVAEASDVSLDLAALEAVVRELRQKIENLGPVNMMALEEYEEAQQRHAFMETQRQDLLSAIADTQKAIQEMDTISRQKFQEAFERINAYFQESFRILFGGGQGFLRLSEMEGAAPDADAGVDIVAQPPGKKLQNALLLSGGEKAMTAMALLLAVFRYQPSPFCLLDEVDAPMDEANVVRFSDMVKQMGATTQFILITHNKRTMEAAPTLYGVTMPQPGVSRLVSVMVEEARRVAS
ncbi:MAG TPA: chromosome segregation protein SMC [Terriglobales bacterium]|nr:chromosome segregation protein SMC [Terriglobales bacterium]